MSNQEHDFWSRSHASIPNWDVNTPEGMINAKRWMTLLFQILTPKAVWTVPRSGMVLQLDQDIKEAVIMSDRMDTPVLRVFAEMGWTIIKHVPDVSGN